MTLIESTMLVIQTIPDVRAPILGQRCHISLIPQSEPDKASDSLCWQSGRYVDTAPVKIEWELINTQYDTHSLDRNHVFVDVVHVSYLSNSH